MPTYVGVMNGHNDQNSKGCLRCCRLSRCCLVLCPDGWVNCTSELVLLAMMSCRQLLNQLTLLVFTLHQTLLEKICKVWNLQNKFYLSLQRVCTFRIVWSWPDVSGYSENDAIPSTCQGISPAIRHRHRPQAASCFFHSVTFPRQIISNGQVTVSLQWFQY